MKIKTTNYKSNPEFINWNKKIPCSQKGSSLTTKNLVKSTDEDDWYFRSLEEQGIILNRKQLEAVRAIEGPVLAIAGAGSGKTSVLTSRVGYMLAVKEIQPQNILLLTFTRKAAEEMKERVTKIPGLSKTMLRDLIAGTFHSVFLRVLRSRGFDQKILSNEKYKQIIMKRILKDMGLKDTYDPETLLSSIGYYKNMIKRPNDLPNKTPLEKEIVSIYKKYEEWKIENNEMDFDDILVYTYELLQEDASLLDLLQQRFKYVLVDEVQDTSPVQHEIVKMIANPQNNLMFCGDDSQTIYSFRASDVKNILNFPIEYENAQTVVLDINYRSNGYIVGLGNEVIKWNKERFEKDLYHYQDHGHKPFYARTDNTSDEAAAIVKNIKVDIQNGDRDYRDYAILYRTHAVSRAIVDHLVMEEIPFVLYSQKELFYEQAIVKPVLNYLRLSLDFNNMEALQSILPSMYLNRDKTIAFVQQTMLMSELEGRETSALHSLLTIPDLKEFQKNTIFERIRFITGLKKLTPIEAIKQIRFGEGNYEKYLLDTKRSTLTSYKDTIQETLDELVASAGPFQTVEQYINFIDEIILKHKQMEELRKQKNPNAISVMTIHASKGLEFPVVYLIGVSERIIPHNSALEGAEDRNSNKPLKQEQINEAVEEERRLLYVAVTRAKEELYISSPKNYRNKELEISRFLKEVFQG